MYLYNVLYASPSVGFVILKRLKISIEMGASRV